MPSSATPSPLDQLAGIARRVRKAAPYYDFTRMMEDAATLATLREVLAEWVEGRRALREACTRLDSTESLRVEIDVARRAVRAEEALAAYLLTPDSPRQAGEEITDG